MTVHTDCHQCHIKMVVPNDHIGWCERCVKQFIRKGIADMRTAYLSESDDCEVSDD